MKKILMFIHDGYADYEASYASTFITSSLEGKVITLAPAKEVTSKGGLLVKVELTVNDPINISDYDLLFLVGGSYWRKNNYQSSYLRDLVNRFISANKPVAAICDAVTYLANNGFLDNKYHTGNGKEYIISLTGNNYQGEAYYLKEHAVIDLPFITSSGADAVAFGKLIADYLKIKSQEERDTWFNMMQNGNDR